MNAKSARKPLPIHTIRSLRIFVSLALFISIFSTASISPVAAASNGLVFNVRQNATGAITANLAKDQISSGTLGYCGSATLSTINFTSWASPVTCSFPYSQSYASGFIKAPFSGMVTLTTSSDDGVQVQVNDWIGINNWDDHAAESDSMAIPMVAGNYYPIKIWYASGGGGGVLSLSWNWSGQSSVIVPSGSLYQSENDFDSCVARSGTGPNCPGSSALQIKQLTGTNSDGLYWIDLNDGSGAKATYSIMNSVHGGGGWMLAMKGKDSASTFGYDSAYWKDANLLNSERPSRNNQEDVDAKYLPFTKSRATDVMVIFPDYAASTYKGAYPSSGDGFAWSENLANNRTWQADDGNSFDFNQGGDPSGTSACASYPSTMQTIFTNSSRCLIRKVESSYSESRNPYDPVGNDLFFSQSEIRFFGFNYASRSTGDQMYKARFGFGWNENDSTDESSNDGSGGIGLKSGSVTITAGTRFGCCAVQGGINGVNNGTGAPSQTNFAFELFVKNTTTITISGASTLRTQNGSSANTTYSADQGNTPTFALSPVISGISINSSTGVVTAANSLSIGTYRETVTVSNALGASAVRAVTIEVIPASGESDDSMTFTGSNYLTSSTESPFDISSGTTFSLSAWVKPNLIIGSGRMIAAKHLQYAIYIDNGVFGFNMYGVLAGNGNIGTGIAAAPARLNEWQHVMLARNGANLKFYLNGQLVYSDATLAAGNSITNGSSQFTIGGIATQQYFSGEIDHVILSSADNSNSVQTYMNSHQPSDSNFFAHYDFNEGLGTTVFNRSASATSTTDLSLNTGSNVWSSVETQTASGAYTTVTFPRTYLTALGWKVPTGVTRASAIVVGGGGGGGFGTATNRPAGGGGGGGVTVSLTQALTPGGTIRIRVGQGGLGGFASDTASLRNGQKSEISAPLPLLTALGGGGGGNASGSGAGGSDVATGGGSGESSYTCTGSPPQPSGSLAPGATVNTGYNGSGGIWGWGGSGGGARGAAANGTCSGNQAGTPGNGYIDPVTSVEYGRGGNAAGFSVTNAIAGNTTQNNGWGGIISYDGGNASGVGYRGSNGIIIVRWITATAPIFTGPTFDTLTAGLTETFTVTGSPVSPLTRSFLWQSSNDTGSVWSNISSGSGFLTSNYTTPTLETNTSGIRYQFRVVVTDSDTAGLFIVETSTAVYLTINPRNTITSNTGSAVFTQKYGESRTAVFTFAFGTGTRTPTVVATTNNQNGRITWSNLNSNSATVRVGTGLPVGTYSETLTVTDSVAAFTTQVLTMTVSKADTITVTISFSTNPVTYNESPGNVTVTHNVTGLVNSETATVTSTFLDTTCEFGGECNVGDTDPGGGKVFYVSPTTFSCGEILSRTCKYLSVAPNNWYNGGTASGLHWATGSYRFVDVVGIANDATPYNNAAGIGLGLNNSRLIVNNGSSNFPAAAAARAYTGGGLSDWYLPTTAELTLLCQWNRGVTQLVTTACTGGTLNTGTGAGSGFTTNTVYWSSSESSTESAAWTQRFDTVAQTSELKYNTANTAVRPIRAFISTAVETSNVPVEVGTYRVGSNFALSAPASLSNYQGVESFTATLTINRARQKAISIGQYEAYPNISSYPLNVYGGSGPGAVVRSLVSAGSAGCSLASNLIITATSVGTCTVEAVKAGTRNYFAETTTATITWITWSTNYAVQSLSGNHSIPLSGGNQVIARTETVTASAFSNTSGNPISSATVGTTIRINSTGFAGLTPAQITATFRPYEDGVVTAVTSTYVELVVPAGAVTGVIALDSPRGVAYTPSFTISP